MVQTMVPSCYGGEFKRPPPRYGRISATDFVLTPQQIHTFHTVGLVTIPNVLTEDEVTLLEQAFDKFLNGTIQPPAKDFCDMSKPFDTPREQWSIVNAMLPTKYDPSLQNNIYEQLTNKMAQQLFAASAANTNSAKEMQKDYDQLLTKLPAKDDAVFSWHQDMSYWPGPDALGVNDTSTATFSLAIDDSLKENGCLRFIPYSGKQKQLRPHVPLAENRDEGHALVVEMYPDDIIQYAPAKRGSLTIHDEYIVHGSGGNLHPTHYRRTYVVAYRSKQIVEAERRIGFTHSHNDKVNWDTFDQVATAAAATVGGEDGVGNDGIKEEPPVMEEL